MRKAITIIAIIAICLNGIIAYGSETGANKERRIVLLDDISLNVDEQRLLQNLCIEANLDYRFVYSILWSESEFVWQTGDGSLKHSAIGYFQISTINEKRMMKDYGLDIYDSMDNLEAGVKIIEELAEEFENGYAGYDTETCVIMCYKCGNNRGKELMKQGYVLDVVKVIKDKKSDFELIK